MTNISNLFKFIEVKRPEYRTPFRFKLIHDPQSITKDELTVEGDLELGETTVTSLPDGLKVGGGLELYGTPITSLPDDLTVGVFIFLQNTPLSQKYSKDEIRKMIQDKGGNAKGNIVI